MSTKRKPRRAVIYVRISRDRDEQTSTESQEAAARAYCAAHGWTVVEVIVERGRSAFKESRANRPGMKRAMGVIVGGAADTFVVWKLDRAARNARDLLNFVHDLEGHEADFASVTESFDTTTPMGRAMLTIVAALAEMESAQKSERAQGWHEHRRTNGVAPTGKAAFGYIRTGANTLELDPVNAPLLRAAARRVANGGTINSTVKWLQDEGATVTRSGLLATLRSPTIAGLVALAPLSRKNGERFVLDPANLTEGGWTPIVDREEWEVVQVVLSDPARRKDYAGNGRVYPLRSITRCACGSGMRLQPDNRTHQATRYKCIDSPKCHNGITQQPVDDAVEAAVLDRLDDATWRSLRASGAATGPDPAEVEAKLERMWKLVVADQIDMDEYAEARMVWRGQMVQGGTLDLPDVASVREAWEDFGPEERHLVFRRVIKSLIIRPSVRRGPGTDLNRVDLVLID